MEFGARFPLAPRGQSGVISQKSHLWVEIQHHSGLVLAGIVYQARDMSRMKKANDGESSVTFELKWILLLHFEAEWFGHDVLAKSNFKCDNLRLTAAKW